MVKLLAGVLLWSLAHLFKRLAPTFRQGMGDTGKLVVTLALFGSLVLMVSGYQDASGPVWWVRQPSTLLISNVLMLLAVYLMVVSALKTSATRVIRHPQLSAVKAWSLGHLLVNGDLPSLVLFGGLLMWALLSVLIINRQDGETKLAATNPSWLREVIAIVATFGAYILIGLVHGYLGYPVFN